MSFIFNFIGGLVRTAAYTTVGLVGIAVAAGGIAIATKPENKNLSEKVKNDLAKGTNNIGDKVIATAAAKTSTEAIDDYIICKMADVTLVDGTKQTYVGALGGWYPVGPSKK